MIVLYKPEELSWESIWLIHTQHKRVYLTIKRMCFFPWTGEQEQSFQLEFLYGSWREVMVSPRINISWLCSSHKGYNYLCYMQAMHNNEKQGTLSKSSYLLAFQCRYHFNPCIPNVNSSRLELSLKSLISLLFILHLGTHIVHWFWFGISSRFL